MKATTWLCPVLTLLCATRLVCTAQRSSIYPLDYADTNMIQDDYLLEKRNKPSLSIVNPLDVLRQRLLLEIARRQMKENTRQVELNRAILKNVGKRMLAHSNAYQQQQLPLQYVQQHWQPQQELQFLHYPNQLDDIPAASIFDFLPRPVHTYSYVEHAKQSPLLDNGETDSDVVEKSKYPQSGNEIDKEAATSHNEHASTGSTLPFGNGLSQSTGERGALNASEQYKMLRHHGAVYNGEQQRLEENDSDTNDSGNAGYRLRYLQYQLHKRLHLKKK